MKPPILDRLRVEDIPKAPDWFKNRVLYIINRFLESVVQILTKNVTFQDNFDAQIYTDTINAAGLTSGYKFKITTNNKPIGLFIMKINKTTDLYTTFTQAPFPLWEYQDDNGLRQIVIHDILGIDNSSDYNVTLLVV